MNNKFDRMRNQVLESAMKRKTDLLKIEVSQEEKDNIDLMLILSTIIFCIRFCTKYLKKSVFDNTKVK